MNSVELSRQAWQAVVASEVPYVMVGGFAVIFYTFPRTTLDVDFVLAMPLSAIGQIARHFPANFILNPQPEMEILTGTYRWMIDVEGEAFRVELFQLSNDAHHQLLFAKRVAIDFPGVGSNVLMPTAEDLVIQKLRWARTKDLLDAKNILSVQGGRLNHAYIEEWCTRHGTIQKLRDL
jgi:hypothetical protein